jgi:predicted nucleic acid-binding protein
MANRLLISDANILIDMEVAGLVDLVFALPYEYMTPDTLFEEELRDSHEVLIQKGLKLESLSTEQVEKVERLGKTYKGVSNHDVTAMVLAQDKETPLLTGDRRLRQVCTEERIDVRGTLWLMDQLLSAELITVEGAARAYELMEEDGSRLPWDEVEKQINAFKRRC